MTTALILAPAVTSEQMDLVKRTVAQGATDAELKLYLYDCERRGVHPLDKLIHFTKRSGKYTPVTSIDYMRSRAATTGEMAGSDDARFTMNGQRIECATVKVYRFTQGQRFAYEATAYWDEYCPSGDAPMWKKMPHTMLAKCAEALALRKAFPQQLAGLYTSDEMDQADRPSVVPFVPPTVTQTPSGAIVDTATGEELPQPEPPAGYYYVTDYRLKNGWHEFKLLRAGIEGAALLLSTKRDIGCVAEQAQNDGVPVKVTTKVKKGAPIDEAYLETITPWEPPKAHAPLVEPILDSDIPFMWFVPLTLAFFSMVMA